MPDTTSSPIDTALAIAEQAILQGEFATAVVLYQAILDIDPYHPVAEPVLYKLLECTGQTAVPEMEPTEPPASQINALHCLLQVPNSNNLGRSEQACRELLQTYPHSATVLNTLGAVHYWQGQLVQAIHAFDMAIRIAPDDADYYNNRGATYNSLGRFVQAIADFDRAIELQPNLADAYNNRGIGCNATGQFARAKTDYEKAIALQPDFAEAYVNQGVLLRNLGNFDDAVANYTKALKLKPALATAHYSLAMMKRFITGDPQIQTMEQLFENRNLAEEDRVCLGFGLAKALEDVGQYDRSFACLRKANRLQTKRLGYQIDQHRREFEILKRLHSANPQSDAITIRTQDTVRPVLVVGMPRSGTTLVEQILASHSRVHGAGELMTLAQLIQPVLASGYEETSLQNIRPLSQEAYQLLHDQYLAALAALAVPEPIIVDKMPLNFRYLGFFLTAFPEAKIVHCCRDARATCWSNYKTLFPSGGNGFAYDLKNVAEFYQSYLDLMAFWREHYPDQIYDLNYERLTENQEAETRQLLAHCDLTWEPQCLDFHLSKRPVATASSYQVRQQIYQGSSQAWREYEDHLKPLLTRLGF